MPRLEMPPEAARTPEQRAACAEAVAGIRGRVPAPMAAWIRNAGMFGTARCTFESNFPVDKGSFGYAVGLNAMKRIAARFYRLPDIA